MTSNVYADSTPPTQQLLCTPENRQMNIKLSNTDMVTRHFDVIIYGISHSKHVNHCDAWRQPYFSQSILNTKNLVPNWVQLPRQAAL